MTHHPASARSRRIVPLVPFQTPSLFLHRVPILIGLVLLCELATGVVMAQTIVVPSSLAAVEGNGNNAAPFEAPDPERYQQVFSASEFSSCPCVITHIAFRPDAVYGSPYPTTVDSIQLNLSTTAAGPDSLSTTFSANVGADDTIVYRGPMTLVSGFTGPAAGPKDFDYLITLQTPFVFDPSLGHLLLDVRNYTGAWTMSGFDAEDAPGDTVSRVLAWGSPGVSSPTGMADTLGLVARFTIFPHGGAAPGPPSGLSASSSGSSVLLTWAPPANGGTPTSYIVEAGSASGLADLANFATGNAGTSYGASGVGAGTYYIRVRAYNPAGISAPSNEAVLHVGAAAPGPPSGLSASSSGSSILLTWQAPTSGAGPTSYIIEAGSAPGRTDLANFYTGSTATTYTASGVGAGTYYVRVRASNAAGTSAPSNEAVLQVNGAVPGPPSGLSVSSSGSSVLLTWLPPGSGAAPTSYIIEAGSSPGLANLANFSTGTTATSYAASGVGPGVYYVRVRAYNSAGISTPSNEAVLNVVSPVPGPPSGLMASSSGSSIQLSWQAPTIGGAPTSYIIEAGSSPGLANLANFSTGTALTMYVALGINPGVYYVRVRATNPAGTSAPSNEAVLTVGATVPGPPTGLTGLIVGPGTVLLAWNAAVGSPISYIVEAGSVPGAVDLANFDIGGTGTSYTAFNVPPGTYYVRVRARNVYGIGPASNEFTLEMP